MPALAHENFPGKRLVIFGCGYVGGVVAREAVARGLQVTALTRNAAKALLLREAGIEVVEADLATDAWHAQIAGGADFVLNSVSSGGGGTAGYRHSYVDGMASIVRWAQARGPAGTLVYTSSTSVYPADGGASVDESFPTGGAERPAMLVEAEDTLRRATGVCARWFILRLAGIYGPERTHLVHQVRTGEVSGRGEHHLNLAHRDDIAAAIWATFAAPPAISDEIFNVADPTPAPKAEVVAWLAQRLGLPLPRFTGEPAAGRRAVTPDRTISAAKLARTLGWRPRYPSYREGYETLLSH